MTERRTVADFPDYSIDAVGTVWRMTPTQLPRFHARYGPVPRKLSVIMVGCKGRRNPAVKLNSPTTRTNKTLATLMRQAWPEVDWRGLK